MKIKFLMFGEALNIPHTGIGLGVGLISVWTDGNGFTSATNQLGALGYVLLETPEIDIGELDEERQQMFSRLHGRTIKFEVAPTIFAKNGGIAQISMTAFAQSGGNSVAKTISFTASDCTGYCATTNALNFTCDLYQMEGNVASSDSQVVGDDALATIIDEAPADEAVA